jgi:hypothetical protein
MPGETMVWLLAGQLVVGVGELVVLSVLVWKTRALLTALTNNAKGNTWATDKLIEVFSKVATNSELTAQAAWNSSVANQAIARDLRPLAHSQVPPGT